MNAITEARVVTGEPDRQSNPRPVTENRPYELGDLLVDYLNQLEIDVAFGVPGGSIEPLLDALARSERRGGTRPVIARHETGAAFMADGYARDTGKLGVCFATTGPGATNMITGVANAYENDVPLLVVTAQTNIETLGRNALQESSCTTVNTVGMFEFCTCFNTLVSHSAQFEHKLISAILAACRERKPAHISLPRDLVKNAAKVVAPTMDLRQLLAVRSGCDRESVKALHKELARAQRVVVLIGEGCDGVLDPILEFADTLGADLIATPHAGGLIDSNRKNYHGVFGFAGHQSATALLADQAIDCVLAVGVRFGEESSAVWNTKLILNSRLIQVDEKEANFATAPMARLHVLGDLEAVFLQLLALRGVGKLATVVAHPASAEFSQTPTVVGARKTEQPSVSLRLDDPQAWCSDAIPIKPQRLMKELGAQFPKGTRYFADVGNAIAWSLHYLMPRGVRRVPVGKQENNPPTWHRPAQSLLRTSLKFGPMGWAIGASVGAALADRSTPSVCITGDGSLLMSGQELTVAREQELNVVFVLLNDSALGMVMHGQRLGGAERAGYEVPFVDFAALARAMGVEAYTVMRPEEIVHLDVAAICRKRGPTLIDVRIDREEVPPMALRVAALNPGG